MDARHCLSPLAAVAGGLLAGGTLAWDLAGHLAYGTGTGVTFRLLTSGAPAIPLG